MKNTKDKGVEVREPQIPGGERTNQFFEGMFNQIKVDDKEVDLKKPRGYEDPEGKRQLKPGEKSTEGLTNDLLDSQGKNKPTEVFEGGRSVTPVETALEVPQVPVAEAQVQPVQEKAQEGVVAPETVPAPTAVPSGEIAQAQKTITEGMEAQPEVQQEEQALETAETPPASVLETPAAEGIPKVKTPESSIRDQLVKGEGDLNTENAAAAEEEIYSPLDGEPIEKE